LLNSETHLAILLNALFGVSVSNLHFFPFQKNTHQNLWIDLSLGHVCYNRNFIIQKNVEPSEIDIFRVPLPKEIVDVLIQKLSKRILFVNYLSLTVMPIGMSDIGTSLKCCIPKGMPMMVMQHKIPEII